MSNLGKKNLRWMSEKDVRRIKSETEIELGMIWEESLIKWDIKCGSEM